MKFSVIIICFLLLMGCNSGQTNATSSGNNASVVITLSDSLYKNVMKGHDDAMMQMGDITRYRNKLIDSLDLLKTQTAGKPGSKIGVELDSAIQKLTAAEKAMNNWMYEFNPDKAGTTEAEKTAFYQVELAKVDTVSVRIAESLDYAKKLLGK